MSERNKNSRQVFRRYLILIVFCVTFFSQYSIPVYAIEKDFLLTLNVNDFSKNIDYTEYSQWFSFIPSLITDTDYVSEIENINNCATKIIFCELEKTQQNKIHTKKISTSFFDRNKARLSIEKIANESYRAPVNAKFKMEGEKVSAFAIDQSGFEVDIEKSLDLVARSFLQGYDLQKITVLSLPTNEILPEISSDNIDNMGINTLLGQGTSNFKGSTRSRIHNIKVATEKYNGYIISPGEEFSFVEVLGPVDGEHGYLPELVIKNNKTEPEFGGGICQVSTTVFRAAIYAGLEITARKNHAYPVHYYDPQGMDATIYIPKPDLKFKNNTAGHILIQTKIDGNELIFSFYGTSDGRKIEVDGPHIIERNTDGSLKTTFSQKVINSDGSILINAIFNSFYDSPSKYPQPDDLKITKKPNDWSKKQWDEYKKNNDT